MKSALRTCRHVIAAAALAAIVAGTPGGAMALTSEGVRQALDQEGSGPARTGRFADALATFYGKRDFRPLWFDGDRLSRAGEALLAALARADEHAIPPSRYGMPALAARVRDGHGTSELALSRAFLSYATDIMSGAVENPRQVTRIFRDLKRPDPVSLLDAIAAAGDPALHLARLPPDLRRYDRLKAALASYREIERKGGWATVGRGPSLKPGMRGARVAQVKQRLLATGDLAATGDAESYDEALVAAVKRFQLRHGLVEDGNVGAETLGEMNVPVGLRIEQLAINLERRRWLAPYLGDRYIYLNIADNDLKVVEKGHTVRIARVIVGKPFQQTPVFSATMTFIEINPYWNVPRSIVINELLPAIRRNPGYLAANGYVLLRRSGDNSSAVGPDGIDWSSGNFPYYIRQLPGPKNALGTLVFRFPNAHNVYLHDTPSRDLFNREARFFSHGCMRVEHPAQLALLLLGGQNGGIWTQQRIDAIIATRKYTVVTLERPIAVHITYLTAWAEADGVQFRRDVYRRDPALRTALKRIGATLR
ncbi:MAG: L,D-transpeptidase family protein [Rhodospirillaceae bacterium]|nr:L,D-transpeptidase family protein [Rhodospirillaceae bacterium]